MKKWKKILIGVLSGFFLLGIAGFYFLTKDIDGWRPLLQLFKKREYAYKMRRSVMEFIEI